MSKPFDVATKRLVEADPLAWLRYAGLPGTTATLMDADLSTVTSEADCILHVNAPEYPAHIELQASYQADMGDRILVYGVLAYAQCRLSVQSVVILLRLGTRRLGPPDEPTQAALEAITSLERLERPADRILEVESWPELLR